jgi:uncharacterized protein YbbC (DUF1343 family)
MRKCISLSFSAVFLLMIAGCNITEQEEPGTQNNAPADIALSGSSIDEGNPAGTVVGALSGTDTDGDALTFSLVPGIGGDDNASFTISGDSLLSAGVFDAATKSSYAVLIRADDGKGGLFDKAFVITVNEVIAANNAPTDIALSNTSVYEGNPAGTVVGALSGTDPDNDVLTFSLVPGTAGEDNASFTISGTSLLTAAVFDVALKSSYAVLIRADDGEGGVFDKAFVITVNEVIAANNAPTGISLSSTGVDEGKATGTVVGTLSGTDADGDSLFFSLVPGTGGEDNAGFTISGASLLTAQVFDAEIKSTYSVLIRADDGKGGVFDKAFVITVNEVIAANNAPTDISLSSTGIDEGKAVGTVVGTLTGTDPDGDALTFSLVPGTGGEDNASFTISGDSLLTAAVFDAAVKSSYAILIRADDGKGGTFDKAFVITVNEVIAANNAPTDIALSNTSVYAGRPAGTAVGTLSGTDPDNDTLTFSLVPGTGGQDNADFSISGDSLLTAEVFDAAVKSNCSILIRANDGKGGTFDKAFTISITLAPEDAIKPGLDVFLEEAAVTLQGKTVGIVTNHSGLTKEGVHIADTLSKLCNVIALFAPEHGIRGDQEAGAYIESYVDEKTGITVWSLYGATSRPTDQMVAGLDVMIYDIQDVGARFYTFITTLGYTMEKAAEKGISYYVLDRINPISGTKVEGPVLDMAYQSFVGYYPIPTRYGLTIGELAGMINKEWMSVECDLTVVKIQGWERDKWFDEYNLNWIKPSPNIPNVDITEIYPGTCIFEGTNVSEGRGTTQPFQLIGAPWVNGDELVAELEQYNLPGVEFISATFTPVSMPGVATNNKYENQLCGGVEIVLTDRKAFNSVQTGIYLIVAMNDLWPSELTLNGRMNGLFGTNGLSNTLYNNTRPGDLIDSYQPDLQDFLQLRSGYLMY